MINLTMFSLILLMGVASAFSINPVKMGLSLVGLSVLLFSMIFLSTGSVWFPTIFLLLFVGGILMMFMILSSLMPNQKVSKLKLLSMMMLLIPLCPFFFHHQSGASTQIKLFMSLSWNILFILLLILFFFFSFIEMIKSDEMSMRSIF